MGTRRCSVNFYPGLRVRSDRSLTRVRRMPTLGLAPTSARPMSGPEMNSASGDDLRTQIQTDEQVVVRVVVPGVQEPLGEGRIAADGRGQDLSSRERTKSVGGRRRQDQLAGLAQDEESIADQHHGPGAESILAPLHRPRLQ